MTVRPALATPGIAQLDTLFGAFADPARIRILSVLVEGELCVCDIVELLGLPQPTVSRDLGLLRRAGLVEVNRAWRYAHYRLAEPRHSVQRTLVGCLRTCFLDIPSLAGERRRAAARVRARATDPC